MRDGCPFCDYEGPSEVLHDFGDAFVIEPLVQIVPGHVLIVPYAHVEDFAAEPIVTGRVFARAAEWMNRLQQDGIEIDANLITSKGRSASQTVFHLHVHVLPRTWDDGMRLPWPNPNSQAKAVPPPFVRHGHAL
jgi:histidine triad (HIT) family protein